MEINNQNFKVIRSKLGLSLRAVARRTGLNYRTICNIENGKTDSGFSKVEKLTNFYKAEIMKLNKDENNG